MTRLKILFSSFSYLLLAPYWATQNSYFSLGCIYLYLLRLSQLNLLFIFIQKLLVMADSSLDLFVFYCPN